jgi:vesicle coat complex subunit
MDELFIFSIKANVKVSSTENGIIFGNIVYDVSGAVSDRNVVVLNDIHIDIMDYIVPASCTEVEFRSMWAEFEWENKALKRHFEVKSSSFIITIFKLGFSQHHFE